MAPAPSSPAPGSMTVPPTFGWEGIATVLALVIGVAVVFLVLWAAASSLTGRAEWQAWLDARPSRRAVPAGWHGDDPTAEADVAVLVEPSSTGEAHRRGR